MLKSWVLRVGQITKKKGEFGGRGVLPMKSERRPWGDVATWKEGKRGQRV